jgi:glycosyltransferase involved in cell wall biosynthesis
MRPNSTLRELSDSQNVELHTISVVIPTYSIRRLDDLVVLLKSIGVQNYSNVELLVVVDSPELLNQIKARLFQEGLSSVRLLLNKSEHNASAARNLGISNSSGEIVAFLDDDTVVFRDWIDEIMKTFNQDPSIIGLTGPAFPLWEGHPLDWFPDEFSWILGYSSWHDNSRVKDAENVWGMNAAFRREAFQKAGFFSDRMGFRGGFLGSWKKISSEENELSIRIREQTGQRIVFSPRVRVWHRVQTERTKVQYIVKRAFHLGKSRATLLSIYRSNHSLMSTAAEHALCHRMITRLFPSILKDLVRNPLRGWKRLSATVVILLATSFGYISVPAFLLGGKTKRSNSGEN